MWDKLLDINVMKEMNRSGRAPMHGRQNAIAVYPDAHARRDDVAKALPEHRAPSFAILSPSQLGLQVPQQRLHPRKQPSCPTQSQAHDVEGKWPARWPEDRNHRFFFRMKPKTTRTLRVARQGNRRQSNSQHLAKRSLASRHHLGQVLAQWGFGEEA